MRSRTGTNVRVKISKEVVGEQADVAFDAVVQDQSRRSWWLILTTPAAPLLVRSLCDRHSSSGGHCQRVERMRDCWLEARGGERELLYSLDAEDHCARRRDVSKRRQLQVDEVSWSSPAALCEVGGLQRQTSSSTSRLKQTDGRLKSGLCLGTLCWAVNALTQHGSAPSTHNYGGCLTRFVLSPAPH